MAARLTTYLVVAIVAATLIAGLIVGAQRDDSDGPVDLIIHNARVFTADADGTIAEAVAVRGNQILSTGDEREITRLRRPQTTVIDAGGATVLPGFNDAHTHLVEAGLALAQVDLHGAVTFDEIRQRVQGWAEANPDAAWIQGRGWAYSASPAGLPARQALDAIAADRPAVLIAVDGQTAWLNTAALKAARVTRGTPEPAGGAINKDPRSGEPTGILRGTALSLVSRVVEPPTPQQRSRALRAAIARGHRAGVTSVHDAGSSIEDLALYAEARRLNELGMRIYAAMDVSAGASEAERAQLSEASRRFGDDALLKAGAAKLRIDGAASAQTGAMLAALDDDRTEARPLIDADALNRLVRLLDAEGWQIMAHASGDRAVRMALDAYQHAARSNAAPSRERRHRIEHADVVDPADLSRFRQLGVIASAQPFRVPALPARPETLTRSQPQDRGGLNSTPGLLAGAGAVLVLGSNWPNAALDPLTTLQLAVAGGALRTGALPPPDRRMALAAAIRAHTAGPAWASFDEQRKGTLTPGMLADIVVLSTDILDAPAALHTARVAYTVFDGKVVYRSTDRGTD